MVWPGNSRSTSTATSRQKRKYPRALANLVRERVARYTGVANSSGCIQRSLNTVTLNNSIIRRQRNNPARSILFTNRA
jgi:hypothetical protein